MLYNKVIKTTIHDFQTHLYLYFSFLQYCSFLVISKTTFLRSINKFVFSFLWLDQYSLHQRSLVKSYFHLWKYFKCLEDKSYRPIYEFQNLILSVSFNSRKNFFRTRNKEWRSFYDN